MKWLLLKCSLFTTAIWGKDESSLEVLSWRNEARVVTWEAVQECSVNTSLTIKAFILQMQMFALMLLVSFKTSMVILTWYNLYTSLCKHCGQTSLNIPASLCGVTTLEKTK